MIQLKGIYFLVIAMVISINAIAQSDSLLNSANISINDNNSIIIINDSTDSPLINPTVMPVFKKGDYKMFIAKNLTYPHDAFDAKIQGKVYLQFIIEADGTVTNITVLKGLHPSLDAEAIRIIKLSSGKWKIALNNGIPVRSITTLTIGFFIG